MNRSFLITGLMISLGMASASADGNTPDKSRYTFFNPTPRELMREMSTDRPDQTESAYTVDAGHFQVEADLLTYTRDRHSLDGGDVDSFTVAPINFKIGLCNRSDLQLVFDTYINELTRDSVTRRSYRRQGHGDLTVRYKHNLWGNDGGKTALALMPYIKAPLNQHKLGNNSWEAGIIVPLAIELPAGWGMGLMTELDFVEEEEGNDLEPEWLNSITFSHQIVGELGGYVELVGVINTHSSHEWRAQFDCGLTYGLTENIQLDCGINIGLNKAADDLNPFVGISWRF